MFTDGGGSCGLGKETDGSKSTKTGGALVGKNCGGIKFTDGGGCRDTGGGRRVTDGLGENCNPGRETDVSISTTTDCEGVLGGKNV